MKEHLELHWPFFKQKAAFDNDLKQRRDEFEKFMDSILQIKLDMEMEVQQLQQVTMLLNSKEEQKSMNKKMCYFLSSSDSFISWLVISCMVESTKKCLLKCETNGQRSSFNRIYFIVEIYPLLFHLLSGHTKGVSYTN